MVATVLSDIEKDSGKENKGSKYDRSPKGKLRDKRYNSSDKGRYSQFKRNLRRRIKNRRLRIAQLEEELNEQKITD